MYRSVISGVECPRSFWSRTIGTPAWAAWTAYVWRASWIVAPAMPAAWHTRSHAARTRPYRWQSPENTSSAGPGPVLGRWAARAPLSVSGTGKSRTACRDFTPRRTRCRGGTGSSRLPALAVAGSARLSWSRSQGSTSRCLALKQGCDRCIEDRRVCRWIAASAALVALRGRDAQVSGKVDDHGVRLRGAQLRRVGAGDAVSEGEGSAAWHSSSAHEVSVPISPERSVS